MVQNNKVLTVSYGTFSCTLEGFDDSFGTMKMIAEYFRDLSSDDRYFGAEPPKLDAEMLAQIARQNGRQSVEALSDGRDVVLRAQDAAAAPPPPAAEAPAPSAPPAAQAPMPPAAEAPRAAPDAAGHNNVANFMAHRTPREPAGAFDDFEDAPALAGSSTGSIAEKLQRIRAVVAPAAPAAIDGSLNDGGLAAAFATPEATADTSAPDTTEPTPAAENARSDTDMDQVETAPETAQEEPSDPAPQTVEPSVEDIVEDLPSAELVAESEERAAPALPEALDTDATPGVAGDATEAEAAYEAQAEKVLGSDETAEGEDGVAELETSAPPEAQLATDEDLLDGTADDTEDHGISALDADVADMATPAEPDEAVDEDLVSDVISEIAEDTAAPFELTDALLTHTPETDAEPAAGASAEAEPDFSHILAELSEPEEEVSAEPAPVKTQLLKLSNSELEAALTGTEADAAAEPSADGLSPEAEADLMRELAGQDAPDDAPADTDAAQDNGPSEADRLRNLPNESQMSRLLDAAGEKMDDPEATGNRETYAHLRAAVAATAADRDATGAPLQIDEDQAYREDLATVVKPRRPEAKSGARDRGTPQRPAPLQLVAEQRIDLPGSPAGSGPVRPRRVAADSYGALSGTEADRQEGFPRFVEQTGANELPELLEAAASYIVHIEQRDQFSRPQLMSMARQIKADRFHREDGLRAFGQLLRDGKILKTPNGRFTVSDDISFKPAQRAVG